MGPLLTSRGHQIPFIFSFYWELYFWNVEYDKCVMHVVSLVLIVMEEETNEVKSFLKVSDAAKTKIINM